MYVMYNLINIYLIINQINKLIPLLSLPNILALHYKHVPRNLIKSNKNLIVFTMH